MTKPEARTSPSGQEQRLRPEDNLFAQPPFDRALQAVSASSGLSLENLRYLLAQFVIKTSVGVSPLPLPIAQEEALLAKGIKTILRIELYIKEGNMIRRLRKKAGEQEAVEQAISVIVQGLPQSQYPAWRVYINENIEGSSPYNHYGNYNSTTNVALQPAIKYFSWRDELIRRAERIRKGLRQEVLRAAFEQQLGGATQYSTIRDAGGPGRRRRNPPVNPS